MGGQLGGPFVKPRTQNRQKLLASRQSVNLIRNSTGKQTRSWVIAGAAVSCLAQQLSEMAEGAFQLQGHQPASIMQQSATRSVRNRNSLAPGMAEDGWLPSFFGHRSRYDTPSVGLLLIAILVLVAALHAAVQDSLVQCRMCGGMAGSPFRCRQRLLCEVLVGNTERSSGQDSRQYLVSQTSHATLVRRYVGVAGLMR